MGGKAVGLWTGQEIMRKERFDTQLNTPVAPPTLEEPQEFREQEISASLENTNTDTLSREQKQESCALLGGLLNEYDECEGVDRDICTTLGGVWNNCGSPCRHSTNPRVICPTVCDPFCQL